MVRRSKVEECLICEQIPCVCGKPSVAKPAKRTSAERPSMASRMRAGMEAQSTRRDAPRAVTDAAPAPSVAPQRVTPTQAVEDLVMSEALRALAPILAKEELEKHKLILTSTPTAAEKLAIWKWRRAH